MKEMKEEIEHAKKLHILCDSGCRVITTSSNQVKHDNCQPDKKIDSE
jgi:hypothetical protein